LFSDFEKIGNIFFLLSFLSFLLISYFIFEPFLEVIVLSIIVVLIFYPLYQKINNKIKKDWLSSLIATFIVAFTFLVPISILILFLSKEIIELIPSIEQSLSNPQQLIQSILSIPIISQIYQKYGSVEIDIYQIIKNVFGYLSGFLFEKGKVFATNITIFIIEIFLMIITVFFLFKDGDKLYKRIYSVIPLRPKEKDFLFYKSYVAIKGVILGSVAVAIAQATLGFIGYFVAGIKYSLFLGFLTFIAAFIPFGGASLVWIPVAFMVFFSNGILAGIIFFLYGTFVISLVDNIIRPVVVSSHVDIHPMILFFTILGGINFFGILGIFIAPVVIVLTDTFIDLFKERYNIE